MLILLLGLVSIDSCAESVPEFDATFTVRYGILRGEMTLKLSHQGDGYLYETSLRPRGVVAWFRDGSIDEQTKLAETGDTLRPLDYSSTDTIADPVRKTRYTFDPDRVTGEYKTQQVDVPMQAGGHNRISVHIAVMKALQSGTEITSVPVFDRGRWKDYRFEVIRDQVADTPSGRFETVEVRYASSDNDRSWSLHFAEELDFLPVLLVFREEGKVRSRARLERYRSGTSGTVDRE